MNEKELVERRAKLEGRQIQLRKHYHELNDRSRLSNYGVEGRKIQAEILETQRALSAVEEEIRQLDAQLKEFRSSGSVYAKKYQSVILAGCITLERHVNELRATLLEGKTPESAGIAGKALPLAPTEAEHAKRLLDELYAEVEEIKKQFSYGLADERPSLSLTYMWASVLLGKMEGVAEALTPSGLEKKYGEMPPDYKDFLQKKLPSIERRIVELRKRYTTAETGSSPPQR